MESFSLSSSRGTVVPLFLSLFLLMSLLLFSSDAFTVHENSIFWAESMFLHGDYPKMAVGYEKLGFKSFADSSSTSGEDAVVEGEEDEEDEEDDDEEEEEEEEEEEGRGKGSAAPSVYQFLHRANKENNMYVMYTKFSISRPTKRSIRKTFPLYLTSSRLHFSAQHEEYPDHSFKAIFRSNFSSNDAISFRSEFDAINHFSKSMNAIFKYVNEHEDYRNYRIAYYLQDLMNAAEIAKVAVGLLFCNRKKAVLPKYEFVTKFTKFVLGQQSDAAADVNLKSCNQVDSSGGVAVSAVCSLLTGDNNVKSSFLDDFTYWVFEEAELLHGVKLFNRNPIEIFQNYLSDTLIPLIKREYEALSSMKRLHFPICKKMALGDFNPDDDMKNEEKEEERKGDEGVDNQQWYSKANFYDFDAKSKIAYFSKLKSLDSYASKSKSKNKSGSTTQSVKVLDIFSPYFEVKFSDNSVDHQARKNVELNSRYFAVASICPLHNLQSSDNGDNKDIASDLLSRYSNFAKLHPKKCQSIVNFRNVDNNIVADRAGMEAYLYTVLWSIIVSDPDASNLVPQSNPRDDSQTYPAVVPYSNLLIDVYSKGLSYGNSDRYRLGTEKEFLISFTNDKSMTSEMSVMSAKYNDVKVLLLGLGSGSFHSFLLSAFPSVYIDSVEANEDVFEAARSLKFNGFCDVLTLESNENDSKTKTVSAAKHFNIPNAVADDHKCRSRVILADYPAYLKSLGEGQFQNTYKYIFVNLNMIDFFESEEDTFNGKGKEEKKLCDTNSCKHVSRVHSLLTNQGLGIWRIQAKADYASILKESIASAFGQKNIVIFKSNDDDLIIVAGKNMLNNLSRGNDKKSTSGSSNLNSSFHPCQSPFEKSARAKDVFNYLGLQEHAELYKYSLDCSNY